MRMERGVTGERKKGGKLCLDIIGRQRFQNDKMGDTKKEAEGRCNSWGSPILRKKGKGAREDKYQ